MYLNSRLKRLVSLKYEIKLTLKVDGANEMKMEYTAVKKNSATYHLQKVVLLLLQKRDISKKIKQHCESWVLLHEIT